jgi:branched-chain amino acid transport system substrate-binding protein
VKHLCSYLLLVLLLALYGCGDDPREHREKRATSIRQAYQAGGEIVLGAVWNGGEDSGFLAGARLAADELNADGGVAGRKIRLRMIDERPFLERANVDRTEAEGRYRNAAQEGGTALAHAVLEDQRIGAVIGHSDSDQTTLSAMSVYAAQGVMLLAAGTSDARVEWIDSDLYFQLLPSDRLLAKKLAEAIGEQHWDTVRLVYANNRHNEQIAELLKSELANRKIVLSGTTALVGDIVNAANPSRRLQNSLSELREGVIDAVVLLAPPVMGAQVIRYARAIGIAQPFIGTMSLDAPDFVDTVRDVGEETVVTSIYRDDNYLARRFAAKFRERFPGQEADKWAALGYDSVHLYAQAVACAETTDPTVVLNALYFKLPVWFGLVGQYNFGVGGTENTGMRFHTKVLRRQADGKLKFVFLHKITDREGLP